MSDQWQPFSEVARRLLAKCEQAMRDLHFEAAETYHKQWIEECWKGQSK